MADIVKRDDDTAARHRGYSAVRMQKTSKWYFAATAAAFFFVVIFIIQWSPQLLVEEKDVWRIQPRFKFHDGNKKRSLASQSISVYLTFDGRVIELDLEENELLKNHPPVFLTEDDGSIKKVKLDRKDMQKPKYMQDTNGRAAVMLRTNVTHQYGSAHEIDGVIFDGNETYQITPIRITAPETSKGIEFSHELKRIAPQEVADHVVNAAINKSSQNIQRDFLQNTPRVRRTALPAYEVQLLFVIDYSTYHKFRSAAARKRKTTFGFAVVQEMQYYFAKFSNLVDLRYRRIRGAPFTIRTKLTSIYIVTKANHSHWTESKDVVFMVSKHSAREKTIKAEEVMELFRRWIYGASGAKFRSSLPNFDHAVLFTAYDMIYYVLRIDVAGIANGVSICTPRSVSVIHHSGASIFDSLVCAHELGHSLGAAHDGQNNACNISRETVMRPGVDILPEKDIQNPFMFSNCSINYFTETISLLKNNCLTDTAQHFYPSKLQSYLKDALGQAFSPDTICSHFFGRSFRACGGTEFGSEVCSHLGCYNASAPVSRQVSCRIVDSKVLDRTTCGNKRWCQEGRCVNNSNAHEAFDDCPLGNFAANYQVRNYEPFVCSDMPTYYCYSQDIYKACCETCNSMKDNNRPGCEYGDRGNSNNCSSTML